MALHTFIQKIFGTGKSAPQVNLTFTEVPAWITGQESTAKETLVTATREPMREIRNGIATLQLIVTNIAGAEHDESLHPKLRTIAKNSLPQFVKAMKVNLNKELLEDPGEFYPVAAECIKNCLHTVQGQGRYLQAIFPDEMKAVRSGIDTLGRGINSMNPVLAAYRKEMTGLAVSREKYETITGLMADLEASDEKVNRSHARIAEIRERVATIDQELLSLLRDPRMKDIDEQRKAHAGLCRKRDDAARTYSALSMTASHVFRKAEKIATKQRHPSEVGLLNAAMEVLSDHEIPDTVRLDAALAAACPLAERMIADGDVVIKNKEERAIFSDTARFREEIALAGSSLLELEEQCQQAESAIASHPLLVKMQSLEREKTQRATMRVKEEQGLSELGQWREKTQKQIPELLQQLREKIAEMSGDNVQLQDPELPVP
jgi:hypothetical protein